MTPAELAHFHAEAFTSARPWSEAEFASLLGGPGVVLVCAPKGFLLGRALAGEAEILTIAVAEGSRRQGIGSGLLRGFLTEAAALGAETVFLEVAEENAAALALYHRMGFAEVGRRRAYYLLSDGRRTDALVLRREANGLAPEI
jgi:[ribosomal protein S18]-alanine N-acetyltransferase